MQSVKTEADSKNNHLRDVMGFKGRANGPALFSGDERDPSADSEVANKDFLRGK